jgi:metal-sulfur cluster biosynthetic enzyme
MTDENIVDKVKANLELVLDPCSRINGTRLSLVELGMIERVTEVSPGEVKIDLFLDDPMCIYMVDIHTEVRAAATTVAGVDKVHVEVIANRLWTSERLHAGARAKISTWEALRRERGHATATHGPVRLNLSTARPS